MAVADDYEEVAQTYRDAALRGLPPTKAVMDRYGIERYTAGRRVARCRDLGLLPPARPGTSPKRNPRAVEVAEALGVSYEALVAAVREHADGDLRL